MKTEVVVIGGGIAGCSTAYFLAKGGHKVVLLEKNSAVGNEASGRPCCGVRQHGRKAALHLAMASVRIWATLGEELESDLEYVRTGNLKVRFNQPDLDILEDETAWEHAQGLREVRMMTKQECLDMIPGLTDTIVGGKYCPTDGIASPLLVCPAIARGAKRLGAEILTNTAATGLILHGSEIRGVTTVNGEIEAETVVNTAGPWAARFNEMAGCYTPTRPNMTHLLVTEKQPRRITPWLGFGIGAVEICQTRAGNLVMGTGRPLTPITTYQKAVNFTFMTRGIGRMIELLPWIADVKMLRSLSGICETTPNQEPYIGSIPGVSGLFTSCGTSGQGFCLGPIIGKVLSELISGQAPCVSLDAFRPGRYSDMHWPEFKWDL